MKLLYQTHSPFARKVLVFAYEVGIADRIDVIHHETSPTNRNEDVFALNPLGKVPVLITDGGEAIIESSVICEYLDSLHAGGKLFSQDQQTRLTALKLQSIADGMSEAGILARWESVRRPENLRYAPFHDGQVEKIISSYKFLEREANLQASINIGHIALATSLSWLEFRGLPAFRTDYPRLGGWYENFAKRPSMLATTLAGDTRD